MLWDWSVFHKDIAANKFEACVLYNFVSLIKSTGDGEGSENGRETQNGKEKKPSISIMFQWFFHPFLGV